MYSYILPHADSPTFRLANTDENENCALLGYYAASNVNSLPTFRDNLTAPSSRVKKLKSRNVGKEKAILAA